ncbi:MAG TPA: 1,4-dihydroxy-2-naphthoate octaprenyltransferase [Deltaproteobacteria bacterium]|nr:1,4-dihydroxy-2-naphthoate octaprenyltransferase [Deltaproteobacteria bacterium]
MQLLQRLKTYFLATRPQFFTATILPVGLGATVAWYEHKIFVLAYFLLSLLAAIFYHAGINVLNDYFDYLNGTDNINRTGLTPFTGGSRMIQNKVMTPKETYFLSIAFLITGSIIGLYLVYERGTPLLFIGVIGLLSGYYYSAPPLFLVSRGLGELLVGLNFGLFTVVGSYYVQIQDVSISAVFASFPLSFLIAAILYINEFPDYDADKAVGKNQIVVRLGKKKARWGFVILIIGAYLSIMLSVTLNLSPSTALFALLPAAFGAIAVKGLFKNYDKFKELIPSIKATISAHLLTGIALIIIFVIS